jgi:ring-1,2-phenylacetyl-CoA epoxidase subunit PaaD
MVSTRTVEEAVWDALREVLDPEIPAVSVVDMGMIEAVAVAGAHAHITFLPTFTGCPAIAIIEDDIKSGVMSVDGIDEVTVKATFAPPWTTGRITEEGRAKLKDFGLAPPTGGGPVLITQIGLPDVAVCPFCGSKNTRNDSAFGPTPCRALYYCESCRNPFEQFKPV